MKLGKGRSNLLMDSLRYHSNQKLQCCGNQLMRRQEGMATNGGIKVWKAMHI
jgi:hypothetical protein